MRRLVPVGIAVAALAALLAVGLANQRGDHRPSQASGAVGEDVSDRFAGFKAASEPNGDLSKVVWPDYVLDAGADVKRLYVFQVTHGELMRYMPCFCGCGQNAGHMSNRDCYVKHVNADGSVVFDSMAPT